MEASQSRINSINLFHENHCDNYSCLRNKCLKWQQVRTWARLIREAESLWRVDVRELRRMGAIELSQLLDEVPPSHRRRVQRWLVKYSASTRFH